MQKPKRKIRKILTKLLLTLVVIVNLSALTGYFIDNGGNTAYAQGTTTCPAGFTVSGSDCQAIDAATKECPP
ncbi:MAG: hypothetical protein WC269_05140, partial [Candidatus Gracilibacteria bacterium]